MGSSFFLWFLPHNGVRYLYAQQTPLQSPSPSTLKLGPGRVYSKTSRPRDKGSGVFLLDEHWNWNWNRRA